MSDVSQLMHAASEGDRQAFQELLPRVYDELRRLAARQLAEEGSNQTLQPTALVHEAFLRLVGEEGGSSAQALTKFTDRRYFFAAAAEAMRRILIDRARRKQAIKHGGGRVHIDLEKYTPASPEEDSQLESLAEALDALAKEDPLAAELVNLRWFAGRSMPEVAELLGLSLRSAERYWAYARAWLYRRLQKT
ncbi:MAG: ECF-type sigma factor [Gemmatales bacterium]